MAHKIDTHEYWTHDFHLTDAEVDAFYALALEQMRPVETGKMAEKIIHGRVDQSIAAQRLSEQVGGAVYNPSRSYTKGQKLIFSALGGKQGKQGTVTEVRKGNNAAYGDYEVITVSFDEGQQRDFAAALQEDHALAQVDVDLDAGKLAKKFAPDVTRALEARLAEDPEWLRNGHRWLLKAMLPKISDGHLNLAEAVVMFADKPVATDQILADLDLDESVPIETRRLALEMRLAEDARFRNVGAAESPLWALKTT